MQRASIEVMETAVIDATIARIEAAAPRDSILFELSPFAAQYGQLIWIKTKH